MRGGCGFEKGQGPGPSHSHGSQGSICEAARTETVWAFSPSTLMGKHGSNAKAGGTYDAQSRLMHKWR